MCASNTDAHSSEPSLLAHVHLPIALLLVIGDLLEGNLVVLGDEGADEVGEVHDVKS